MSIDRPGGGSLKRTNRPSSGCRLTRYAGALYRLFRLVGISGHFRQTQYPAILTRGGSCFARWADAIGRYRVQ